MFWLLTQRAAFYHCVMHSSPYQVCPEAFQARMSDSSHIKNRSLSSSELTLKHIENTQETHIFKHTGHVYKIRLLKATSGQSTHYWRLWKAWNGYPLTVLSLLSDSADIICKVGYTFQLRMFLQILHFQLSTWISFSTCFLSSGSTLLPLLILPFCLIPLYW